MLANKCYDQYDFPITHLTQWDSNVILRMHKYKCDVAPIVHFFTERSESAKTVTATLDNGVVSVVVPNSLLTESGILDICVFQYDSATNDGHVIRRYKLPIAKKPKPDDYEYIDNADVIELKSLSVQLNNFIAEIEANYESIVQGIKDEIKENVEILNQSISDNKIKLESDIDNTLQAMLESVSDGSPRGIFTDVEELSEKPSGIYLYINPESADNGYVFWWDGESATKLVYYAGIVVNNNTITYEMLSNSLRRNVCETVVSYELTADGWSELTQEIDISDYYFVTPRTKANVDIGEAAYNQLVQDGCGGIYIQTNDDNENKLIAHALLQAPTENVTIQITLKEVR